MAKSGNQTKTGKAFEYACAQAIFHKVGNITDIEVQQSPQLSTARRYYSYLKALEQDNYRLGADAAIRIIDRLEPNLFYGQGKLTVGLQTDSQGQAGDVRDVLCKRGSDWQIGLSCKHNHKAVKHSRVSDSIDIGKEWFKKKASQTYFDEMRKVFSPLRRMRERSLVADKNKPALWSDILDKEDTCYVPVLKAFREEIARLDSDNPGEIPGQLIRYLIGRNDFYKVIMNDKKRYTQIDAININGTLNKVAGNKKALVDVPTLKLPKKFYEIGFEEDKRNTLIVVCDQGWQVSMRIHNASSRVEPSLKFDVQLLAMPQSILTQIEPWD